MTGKIIKKYLNYIRVWSVVWIKKKKVFNN